MFEQEHLEPEELETDHQEDEIYATLVEINQEPTELYKILKIENLVSGGGEAKQAIAEGYVLLNGEVETRKRKKVYAGDLVSFNGQHLQVALKGQLDDYEFVDDGQAISAANNFDNSFDDSREVEAHTPEQAKNNTKNATKPKKRKPIQF